MTRFDRTGADRWAVEFAEKQTPARALNAAQCLGPALAEIDRLQAALDDLDERRNRNSSGVLRLTDLGMAATEP